jgi:hypothetical protein
METPRNVLGAKYITIIEMYIYISNLLPQVAGSPNVRFRTTNLDIHLPLVGYQRIDAAFTRHWILNLYFCFFPARRRVAKATSHLTNPANDAGQVIGCGIQATPGGADSQNSIT